MKNNNETETLTAQSEGFNSSVEVIFHTAREQINVCVEEHETDTSVNISKQALQAHHRVITDSSWLRKLYSHICPSSGSPTKLINLVSTSLTFWTAGWTVFRVV